MQMKGPEVFSAKRAEKSKTEEKGEEQLYQERSVFVKEHYPLDESDYDTEDLLNDSLDGKRVMEKRDESSDIEGILTYDMGKDNENIPYYSLGIALTREESRGEGVMNELFANVKERAEKEGAQYIVGIADTLGGEDFLLSKDFYVDFDEITNREYFRLDLE